MSNNVALIPQKDTGIAYLCWFVGGGLGVHQFYLGKPGRAVLYWLTFFGICGILPLIDLFTLGSQVRTVNAQLMAQHRGALQSAPTVVVAPAPQLPQQREQ